MRALAGGEMKGTVEKLQPVESLEPMSIKSALLEARDKCMVQIQKNST